MICGIFYYLSRSVSELKVSFDDAQINHEFDMEVYEYNLYTASESIKINCNLDIEGCNKTIILDSGSFVYTLLY